MRMYTGSDACFVLAAAIDLDGAIGCTGKTAFLGSAGYVYVNRTYKAT